MFDELVAKCRSYRRFFEDVPIEPGTLREVVALARLSASGGNIQPLKYILSCDRGKNDLVFPCLVWAGYLDWDGPDEGERPTGYVIILGDTNITSSFGYDPGIAAQSIMLGAVARGLGGCMFGSIKRDQLRQALDVPEHLEILLALALGKPKEEVVIEDAVEGDVKYYRDAKAVHHVPKRPLDELIVG